MEVTEEMLAAAMKVAVEKELVPKSGDADAYLQTWDAMKSVIQAALDAAQ